MGTMGMVGFGVVSGPSSLVSKSLGGEARGRPVMVDMVRMWRKEGTKGERYKRPLKAKKQG
jgi:hypothetical protein